MSNTLGTIFKVTTFGESHGAAVGVVIDGIPAGMNLNIEKVQHQLKRRRPGQSNLTSSRNEPDAVEVLSGVINGKSLGTPLCAIVRNIDKRVDDYLPTESLFRPSHADFSTFAKYGIHHGSGGGRSSARETIGRVIAGAIAEQILETVLKNYKCVSFVKRIGQIESGPVDDSTLTREFIDSSEVRCPDQTASKQMVELIRRLQIEGDTVGGLLHCYVSGIPAGLGDPVFEKLEANLAKGMLSLPASKSFEIGSGLKGTNMKGSEHNDQWTLENGQMKTTTNFSGGIQGGISNGMPIYFDVGFKPVSTIFQNQKTISHQGQEVSFKNEGRHDPCVLPRAVPMVEAMTNIIVLDHFLRQRACSIQGEST